MSLTDGDLDEGAGQSSHCPAKYLASQETNLGLRQKQKVWGRLCSLTSPARASGEVPPSQLVSMAINTNVSVGMLVTQTISLGRGGWVGTWRCHEDYRQGRRAEARPGLWAKAEECLLLFQMLNLFS